MATDDVRLPRSVGPAALLMDYAGVMTRPIRDCHLAWCDHEQVDPASLDDVLRSWGSTPDSPLLLVERGVMATGDFEIELAARLRTRHGRPVEPRGLIDRIRAFFEPVAEMHALVGRARSAGVRTGLVTNSWGSSLPADLTGLFDETVASWVVGARKPDPEIYAIAADRLGVPPGRCVFVDDVVSNVVAAAAVSMIGVHHVEPAATRSRLRALFGDAL